MATKSGGKTIFGKVARRLQIPCGSKISSKSETQDGRQKWWENNFCENSPVDSAKTLWVKNFVEIALCRSVSEINAFSALRKIVTFS